MISNPLQTWEILFRHALELIEDARRHRIPVDRWTFGGGTVLMRRHRHRLSKDVDIFIDDPQFLGYLTPRLSPTAEALLVEQIGRLMVQLLAAFAEFERAQIRERVTAGLKHAKRHGTRTGKAIGRPATAADRSPRIRALLEQGVSLPEIAKRLEMLYSSVHRIARDK